jgi:ubiquinone/menaquinone biosynthesis C-methylase UbiE
MKEWIFGYQVSKAIYTATELGIPDKLQSAPLTIDALSRLLNCQANALYRLLRTLSSIGIFQEIDPHVFAQTDLSNLLVTDNPNTLAASTLFYCGKQYQAWGELTDSIRTGQDSFSHIYKEDFFSHVEHNPDYLSLFNQHLNNNVSQRINGALAAYDFSITKKIVDIGGGDGRWLIHMLEENTQAQGIVFDSDKTINMQNKKIKLEKLGNRIEFIAGDYLEYVPEGGDLYFLFNIIHRYNDEKATAILKNCHNVIEKNGKILLVERLILPENKPDYGKWMDLSMLLMLNGQERVQTEYEALLSASGFKLTNIIPTAVGLDLIEATPK